MSWAPACTMRLSHGGVGFTLPPGDARNVKNCRVVPELGGGQLRLSTERDPGRAMPPPDPASLGRLARSTV